MIGVNDLQEWPLVDGAAAAYKREYQVWLKYNCQHCFKLGDKNSYDLLNQ